MFEILLHLAVTVVLLGLIVWICTVFTNSIEHLGKALNLGHGAVGSVFAAIGTALPETIVPLVAILGALFISHDVAVGEKIGIGAILGAPFLLSTLAMFLVGAAVFVFSGMKLREKEINADYSLVLRDLKYFFISYGVAICAGFVKIFFLKVLIGVFLIAYYCHYAYRTIIKSQEVGYDEEGGLDELLACKLLRLTPCNFLIWFQIIISLALLVIFAHLFVGEIKFFANYFSINPLILSLMLSPVATELPEKVNSVIWIKQNKDTLALGNITGAMVFQSAIPVAVGIFLTPWVFDASSITNIIMVLCSCLMVALCTFSAKRVLPQVLLLCGVFYLIFFGYVVVQLL